MKKVYYGAFILCIIFSGYYIESLRRNPTKQIGTQMATTLPSGLSYTILKEASENAMAATPGNKLRVHYTGYLDKNHEPGPKFDSSIDRQQPFQFTLGEGQVIKGWEEGVSGMKIGETRRLFIPSSLGYGSRGAGAIIPPNAALIFDVTLLEIL